MKLAHILLIVLFFGIHTGIAQEDENAGDLQTKTVQVTDSITIPVKVGDLVQNTLVTNVKDTVVFALAHTSTISLTG